MTPIQFDALIVNGTITIPAQLLPAMQSPVHVTISAAETIPSTHNQPSISAFHELFDNPDLKLDGFQPLSRDEAHE
jgi:hypothetical protein